MQSRREFLLKMALLSAGLAVPIAVHAKREDKYGELLPLRKLGNTGENVTMLGLGGFHIGQPPEQEAQRIIETAIEKGIRFFDNAHNYWKGESEVRYGKFLTPKFRDDVFIMTKTGAGDYRTAKEELERSLTRMKIDQVDLWQLHSLKDPIDVDNRIKNGVLKAVEEALKEKKIRYAGFTCHNSPRAMLRMLEQTGNSGLFSTAQMPINVIDAYSNPSFIQHVLPSLNKHNMGVLGMKSLADGRFFKNKVRFGKEIWNIESPLIPDYISVEEAIQFAWTMPISSLIVGPDNVDMLNEKIDFVTRMGKVNEEYRQKLIAKITDYPLLKKVEYYKKDRDYTLMS
ncbi:MULTISPECIES: aldo/keto reductase [unclassified Saccharicrinis]|uniref:aldo/keto reductase n=1 Tax=unclassified Saccharicrinis TaxID=2646859 RepID=UPI003D355B92